MKKLLLFGIILSSCSVKKSQKVSVAYDNMAPSIPINSIVTFKQKKVITHGDLIVLRHNKGYATYRVLGIPGDSVRLDTFTPYINNKADLFYDTLKNSYIISYKDKSEIIQFAHSFLDEESPNKIIDESKAQVFLTRNEYYQLKNNGIDITPNIIFGLADNYSGKPNNKYLRKLYIPKISEKVDLNNNFYIYGLNNAEQYKVKKNLYFVLNDNLEVLSDSRDMGLIPIDSIVGVVSHIEKARVMNLYRKKQL